LSPDLFLGFKGIKWDIWSDIGAFGEIVSDNDKYGGISSDLE